MARVQGPLHLVGPDRAKELFTLSSSPGHSPDGIRAAVFDLDGTLADDLDLVYSGFIAVYQEFQGHVLRGGGARPVWTH